MYRTTFHGSAPQAASSEAGAALLQRPGPAQPRVLRRLFEDARTMGAQDELHLALRRYLDCARAPNHDALCEMRSAIEELKDSLDESDAFEGTTACQSAIRHAERALLVNDASLAAPQLLLSHLDRTIRQYLHSDDDMRKDRTPQLYVALTRYLDLLSERHMAAPEGDHTELGERHERVRALLFEPQRQRIVRDFAQRAAQPDGAHASVLAQLGITPGYRASEQDRKEFRALFEGGHILRSKMQYTPPSECRALYLQYEHEVGKAMAQDAHSGSNLDDLIAVRTYTVSSNEINQAIRENDMATIHKMAPYLRTLVSGLAQLRATSRTIRPDKDGFVTLKRAVEMSEADILRAGYVPGVTFCQATPMSCSDSADVSYWRMRHKYNVHMNVRCKSARRLGDISRHAHSEAESVIAPETWFKVIDAVWRHGGTAARPWLDLTVEEISGPPSTSK